MRYIPNYQLAPVSEEDFPRQMAAINARLDRCRREGFFSGFDGNELYYEYFLGENSTASVVLVHGLSEFTAKFHEFADILLNQGFNVFLYDQRSHGRSCRLTQRQDMIHVDQFGDYVLDLECFLQQVVLPAENKPLYLFSHSMGGAVAISYLAAHPGVFQKAVLSAPMLMPCTGRFPGWLSRMGTAVSKALSGPTAKFPGSREFDPDYPFNRASDASYARFAHNLQLRKDNPCYQTSPMTLGWVHESLKLSRKLLRAGKKITVPVLLLSGEQDRVVRNDLQQRFAEKCDSCTFVSVPGAKHALLSGSDATRQQILPKIVDFYRDAGIIQDSPEEFNKNPGMNWGCCRTGAFSHADYARALENLTPSRKARIQRLRREEDRKCSLAAGLLVEKLLEEAFDIRDARLESEETGAPRLHGSDLFVSISHSGDLVACAVGDRPVGIDCEQLKPRDMALAKRVCTEAELHYVFPDGQIPEGICTDGDTLWRFYEIWTGKEAFFKLRRTGITDLKSVDVLSCRRRCYRVDDFCIQLVEEGN